MYPIYFFIDAFINSCNEKLNVYTPNQSAIIYIFIISLSISHFIPIRSSNYVQRALSSENDKAHSADFV